MLRRGRGRYRPSSLGLPPVERSTLGHHHSEGGTSQAPSLQHEACTSHALSQQHKGSTCQTPSQQHEACTSQASSQQYEGSTSQTTCRGSGVGQKRVRGPTRNLRLAALPPGQKLKLDWDESDRPIDPNAKDFANHIGVVVRYEENAPLDVPDWPSVPNVKKTKCLAAVLEKFDFELTERRTQYIMEDMALKFRAYRHRLREKYYKPFNSDNVRLANGPQTVSKHAWEWLVKYWGSKEYKDLCQRNKQNISNQRMIHYSGTRSFARVIHKWTTIHNGQPPTRLEVFKITRTRKNGRRANPQVELALDKITQLSTQPQEEGSPPLTSDEILSQVLPPDRPGRVKCTGRNVSSSESYASRRNREEKQKEEVQSLRTKLETTHTELTTTQVDLATTRTEVGELRGQVNILFSLLQNKGFNLSNVLQCPPTNSRGSSCS